MKEKKSYMIALDSYLAESHTVKLTTIGDYEKMSKNAQEALHYYYNHPNTDAQRFGTILNSIFTQHNNVFTMSQPTLAELVKSDLMIKYKNCGYPEYNRVISLFLSNGHLIKLREPKGRRPALYELIEPELLGILVQEVGKEVLGQIRKKHIDWYDNEYGSDSELKCEVSVENEREQRKRERDEYKRKLRFK